MDDPTAVQPESFRRRRAAWRRRPAKRRGQSLVELALALPLLLLIMLGTIDLGRMFFDYVQMRNAVREGVAYAARNPSDAAGARQRVQDHPVPAGTSVTGPTCSGNCTTIDATGTVTMTARRTFTPVTTAFLQNYFGLGPITLTATASMRAMT